MIQKKIVKDFNISQASLRKYKKMTDEEVENIAIRIDYKESYKYYRK